MAPLQVWEKTRREKLWQAGKCTVHWKYFHHRGGAKVLQFCLPQGHPMTNVPWITSCFKTHLQRDRIWWTDQSAKRSFWFVRNTLKKQKESHSWRVPQLFNYKPVYLLDTLFWDAHSNFATLADLNRSQTVQAWLQLSSALCGAQWLCPQWDITSLGIRLGHLSRQKTVGMAKQPTIHCLHCHCNGSLPRKGSGFVQQAVAAFHSNSKLPFPHPFLIQPWKKK